MSMRWQFVFFTVFLNPEHEVEVAAEIEKSFDNLFISVSSEVAPEFREFERFSTCVVNAFLGPMMRRNVRHFKRQIQDSGLRIEPHITQSNGGVIGLETAGRFPVRTLLSGPSTGVVAAQSIAAAIGLDNIITFDAGGTSSDVALLENRICKKTGEAEIHGYPIKIPMFDIHTVGAGGGSIAHVDSGGLLKVGPESAGAHPGPACYGMGGDNPTVTDANVVLQTLNPVEILGGRMKVRRDMAIEAVDRLAKRIGMSLHETAQGIVSVATANMVKAIRVISVRRGHDPRDYALFAYGGSGPLHAARLARELEISSIVVPPAPGALCALGLLLTDLKSDFTQSLLTALAPDALDDISAGFDMLEFQAREWSVQESIELDQLRLVRDGGPSLLRPKLRTPNPVSARDSFSE